MTDMDAAEYLEELMDFNQKNQLTTPKNNKFDTFYQCALEHAVRALKRTGVTIEPASTRNDLEKRILAIFRQQHNWNHLIMTMQQEDAVISEIKKMLYSANDCPDNAPITDRDILWAEKAARTWTLSAVNRLAER